MTATKRSKKAAPSGEASLSAMIPQCPPLPPGELGRWMDTEHRYNLIDFLNSLEAARAMWRKCPQFVQAPTLFGAREKLPTCALQN